MTAPTTDRSATTVGYGVPYADVNLAVACPHCRAPIGVGCTVGRGRARRHAPRVDRRLRLGVRACLAEVHRREAEALRADPDAPLWRMCSNAPAHPCGTAGVHVMTDCTPLPEPSTAEGTTR